MYVMLKEFAERPRRCRPTTIAAALRERVPAEDSRRHGDRLRRAADRRPGHHRRLQDDRSRTAATWAWPTLQTRQRRDRRRRATRRPDLQGLFNSSRANTPWLYLDIDRDQVHGAGRVDSDVFNALQVYLGSYYVNNFNEFGRTWQVNVRPTATSATASTTSRQLKVRNTKGRWCRWARCMHGPRHQRPGRW